MGSGIPVAAAPAGLGKAGRALWRDIARQIADDGLVLDARELRWLRDACFEADQLAVLEAELAGAALVVKGSQNQPVAHPLIGEARRCRVTIAGLLARIGLEDPNASVGSGRGSRTTSESARAAAMTRHHRSRSGLGDG